MVAGNVLESPQRGTMADLDALAAKQAGLAEKLKEKAGGETLTWLDEVKLIEPVESITETIEGHQFAFTCPKTGAFLRAFPALQEVFEEGRRINPEVGPLAVISILIQTWDGPQFFGASVGALCKVLDIFLGKEAGFIAENFRPDSILQMVRNYLRVIPYREIDRFFGEIVGAAKGQAAAASKQNGKTPPGRG